MVLFHSVPTWLKCVSVISTATVMLYCYILTQAQCDRNAVLLYTYSSTV